MGEQEPKLIAQIREASAPSRERMRQNAERLRGDVKRGTQAEKWLSAYKAWEAEVDAALEAWPDAIPFARAFRVVPLDAAEHALIAVLADNPGSTSAELSIRLGWKAQSWHLHFGKLCAKCEHLLGIAEYVPDRDARWFCGLLADYDTGSGRFTIRPSAARAFERL